jgi:hypothetical protein
MVPSVISCVPPGEISDGTMETNPEYNFNEVADKNDAPLDARTMLYTDAYTHGYTEGYIKGYEQPESPRKMPIEIVGMSCRLPGYD